MILSIVESDSYGFGIELVNCVLINFDCLRSPRVSLFVSERFAPSSAFLFAASSFHRRVSSASLHSNALRLLFPLRADLDPALRGMEQKLLPCEPVSTMVELRIWLVGHRGTKDLDARHHREDEETRAEFEPHRK